MSQQIWQCECGSAKFNEIKNSENKMTGTITTVVECSACKKQDEVMLTKYNRRPGRLI